MEKLVANKDKHQWFTPVFAAARLIEFHFPDLTEDDMVVEPTCGSGNFLKAIPDHVPAYGVELDPEIADLARQSTGRHVITGDFTTVDLPANPTHLIGNPPFDMDVVDAILSRCHDILPDNGRVGLILPAYGLQTASRVVGYKSKWSLYQEMIPRNLFKKMEKPLNFVIFKKDKLGLLQGFALYEELHDVNSMKKDVAETLSTQQSPWKKAIIRVVKERGGQATLDEIYNAIEPRRPTSNNWWKAKIRQTLNRSGAFTRIGHAAYAIAA